MKLREKPFFQVSVPIFAQVLLFFINYAILYTPFLLDNRSSRERAMIGVTLVFSSVVMGFGYDKMRFWIIGWILYFIATSIAAVYFIEIRMAPSLMNFNNIIPHINAIGVFIIQFIILCLIKISKVDRVREA